MEMNKRTVTYDVVLDIKYRFGCVECDTASERNALAEAIAERDEARSRLASLASLNYRDRR